MRENDAAPRLWAYPDTHSKGEAPRTSFWRHRLLSLGEVPARTSWRGVPAGLGIVVAITIVAVGIEPIVRGSSLAILFMLAVIF
ncbi:MAG: hypothetical protein ABI823_08015, partial [Bryobacteraceae bacterium]